ncbi:hypothetical protein [Microseira wollei]|uniref:Transposase n=1 Tax=Microseira wollei NIES-4236 TaxID=2530354 RepID=A0AAV3XPQ6_9CYAN|nr:hypothetical protein [Microseira wollei]GET42836.1 hypothetical protein MiSe_76540 [Microseira wollei NIES-4236]
MKQSPNDKEMDELVQMGKILEEKAKKFSNLADIFVKKYKKRLRDRRKAGAKKQEIK